MYWPSPHEFEFSSEREQLLKEVGISLDGPGTILHDFEVLLSYTREHRLRVTGTHLLPLRELPKINALLTRPLEHGLKRPQHKSFPHIHGMYLLLRASGLTYIDESDGKPFLIIDDDVDRAWRRLNPTERYFTLLETWFIRGKPEIIGERGYGFRSIPNTYRDSHEFLMRLPDEGLIIAGDKDREDLIRFMPGLYNLGLLDLFGLVDVQYGTPEPGKGWIVDRVARSPFGIALMTLLHNELFGDFDKILKLEDEREIPFGVLQPALLPYFPQWQNFLSVPKWEFRKGVHILLVSLGPIWRRIAIPAENSLDTLASTILNAVSFDHDHLYLFSYQNRYGGLERVHHPYMDEGPWTSEVSVGDVPLQIGQTMTFLFDFGDQWEFDVTLDKVESDMDIKRATILEEHGDPPEQYPTWDDW
jgi:hypothetical protein